MTPHGGKVAGCAGAPGCPVETVTVAAERINPPHTSEMVVLIGIALVIVAIAWMVVSGVKRNRHQPRA